jgi:hypothetical protein
LNVADGGSNGDDGPDPIRHSIDPAAAVRSRFDATALLVLWWLRSAAPAVFIVGVIYAWLVSEERFESIPQMSTPGQAVAVLLSPFAGIAIAIILRFGVGIAALVLAYPLGRRESGSSIGPNMWRRPFRVWTDRLHLVRAYRSLRWTSTVGDAAADRIGQWGKAMTWSGPVLVILDVLLVVLLIVVVILNPRS